MKCPDFSAKEIGIVSEDIYFSERWPRTLIKETKECLKLQTQDLCCDVECVLNESFAENRWTIGLIQGCDSFYQIQKYGFAGFSAWDFHPLRTNRAKIISDSDTVPSPFYSNAAKFEISPGFVPQQIIKVSIKDLFMPFISWSVLDKHPSAYLTEIFRRQSFFIWLIALKRCMCADRNNNTCLNATTKNDDLFVLRTYRWTYNAHIEVDPEKPLGSRVVAVNDKQEQPLILDKNVRIPSTIFNGLTCNEIQSLIWHSADKFAPKQVMVEPIKYWVDRKTFYQEMFD